MNVFWLMYVLLYMYILGDVIYSKVYVIDNVYCRLDIIVFNGVIVEIMLL